jgi:hypothetical protein
MKLKTLLLSIVVASAPMAVASNISLSDFSGSGATFTENVIRTSGGSALANGAARIRIGFFAGGLSSEVAAALGNTSQRADVLSAISNNFVPLGEGVAAPLGTQTVAAGPRIGQRTVNTVSQAGRLLGQVTGVTPTGDAANSFNPGNVTGVGAGTRLYVLIYDNADISLATELGIFSATSWTMPANNLSNLTMNTVDVNTPAELIRGRSGSLILAGFPVIPEPSTGIMALIAGLGLISRRRR